MKKITLLILMLFTGITFAQVQVGTGTTTTTNVPIVSCYGYTYAQQVYYQSEINAAGDITSISFYMNTAASTNDESFDWTIYLGHSTKTEFATTTDWEPIANLTQVYTGIVTYPANGNWMQITFDTPFTYNNVDNLIVAVDENQAGFDCSTSWNKTDAAVNRSIWYRSDSTNPDPATPPTATSRGMYFSNAIFGGIAQSCPSPSGLAVSNVTTTTSDLSWTAGGTETSWNIEVVDITGGGTATGTATATGVANPYGLTGLVQNNSYEFYVQADCGGDVSTWVGPFAFNTPCSSIVAPYSEDFETFTTAASAFTNENCWSGSGGAYYWESAPGTDTGSGSTGPDPTITTGNYFYTEASSGTAGDITELSAPMVDLSALTNPSLSFSYHMFGVQIGTLDVVVNGTVEFTLTGQQQASATDPFLPVFVDLAAYTGQTIQVIFRATSAGTFEGDIAIDNVSFDETPTCFAPSALSAFNIDGFSADVTWTENGTASLYNLELVDITAGGTQTMTATHAGVGNPSTFTGLDPENDYEYYVQADCGGSGVSAWVGPFAFSTTVACPAPFGLNATNITASSADLSWTAGASETLWNVEVVDVTAGGTQTMTPTATGVANPYMLTGLTDANDYAFYVQADCTGTAGVSTWAGPFNFTTACNAFLAPYTEDFESFTVASSAFNSENCWTGTNIGGYLWEVAATTDTSSGSTGPGSGVSSGNYLFTEATSGATGDAIDLISPSIDLSGLTTPALFFDYHMFGADMGTLDVLVNGTTNVFSLMGQQQTAETDSFITAIVDLSAFTGQTIQVTFRGTKGAGFTSDMAIDNVSFNEAPSCLLPTALAASNLTTTTADLSWTAGGTETTWNIEVVDITAGGTATGIATVSGVTNPYVLSGLTPDNDYEYYVQADCGVDGVSGWVGPLAFRTGYCIPSGTNTSTYINTFSTTLADTNISNVASGLSASNYGDFFNTQSLSIIPGGTFDFNIEIVSGTVGCAIWVDWNNDLVFDVSEAMYSTTSYGSGPFTGSILVPATAVNGDYRMRVMIDWNDSNPGDDSACSLASGRGEVEDYKITVDSTLSTLDFDEEVGFSYYPNPVNDNLTLQAQKEITNVSVYNMIGQEVYRNAPNTLTNEVNMSNLQSGAYFVKVTVGDATETIKVIKN